MSDTFVVVHMPHVCIIWECSLSDTDMLLPLLLLKVMS